MNNKNNIWQRILDYSTNNSKRPTDKSLIFSTKTGIEFWIQRIDDKTILPVNTKGSKLFRISRDVIQDDIENNRGGNPNLKTDDFGTPAPAYRYALLNDPRIWLKN